MENNPLIHLIDSSLSYLQELKKERASILPSHTNLSEIASPLIIPKAPALEKKEELPTPAPDKALPATKEPLVLTPIVEQQKPIEQPSSKKSTFTLHPATYATPESLQDLWTLKLKRSKTTGQILAWFLRSLYFL